MNSIPIFDCLTHPTIDGNWINDKYEHKNSIDILLKGMAENHIKWAFAVGMQGIGNYDADKYSNFIKARTDALYPIAYFNFGVVADNIDVKDYLLSLKRDHYLGIKIHPRFSSISLDDDRLESIIYHANRLNMVVMLCTYFYGNYQVGYLNNLNGLIKLLTKVEQEKIILLHSGAVRLLEMMEIARAFPNILLDLSYTLCKYEGSSLDMDIKHLFRFFDKRICIGSDSPEFSSGKLRERFEFFATDIERDKLENIAYKNIFNFYEIGDYGSFRY